VFKTNCKTHKAQVLYGDLCVNTESIADAESFIKENFTLSSVGSEGLLTGYYEPELKGSLKQTKKYKYPIYNTPDDLILVKLGSVYKNLNNYRLRGRLESNVLVPYYTREELGKRDINASVICYTDSKIDLFFLEVQGSGRVRLENGKNIFIGYDNQNGHPYKSIGKYLISLGEISQADISLQSIRTWFVRNPNRVDEILNYNPSKVFFKQRKQGATGALGVELTPLRSIAIDKRRIPLGSMLLLQAHDENINYKRIVFAQDTGGAIKGEVRADMFLGFGKSAGKIAGRLKAPLKLWLYKPKEKKK
jgi:membrane-bound lytic murein transglycosylase A